MKNYTRKVLSIILVSVFILAAVVPVFAETSNLTVSEATTQKSKQLLSQIDYNNESSTSLRMQPLVDKYNSLTQSDLATELAKYLDSTKHWGKDYISKISALEIISGYGNGKFGPNDKLTGGQFILMLFKTMGYKLEVPQGTAFYKPYVDLAIKEGILNKGEITDYKKPISRELAVSLARRVLGTYEAIPNDYFVKGVDTEGIGDKGFFDNVFVGYQQLKMRDYETITSKYLQHVIDCYRMGIISGSNNNFVPKGNLTRAEAAVIIVKLLDKGSRVESVPSTSESFKYMNPKTMDEFTCSDDWGRYENKEYTLYKGYFPLMEIWDTVFAMNKNKDKINGGANHFGFGEKDKRFSMRWFINSDLEQKYRLDNWNGVLVSQNTVGVLTHKTLIKKGERDSIYDNTGGFIYSILSHDVDNYNKALKPYVYEVMKVWFGAEYATAKTIHDKYLNYALRDEKDVCNYYLINGRQVRISGGRDIGGIGFNMQVWVKDAITKDTMYKY